MKRAALVIAGFVLALATGQAALAGDYPQWCGTADRNRISSEKDLPDRFDEATAGRTSGLRNVKWAAPLAAAVYGSPVVAGGRVYIGGAAGKAGGAETLGMLWCFRESDGKLLWRFRSPYWLDIYNRSFGICATPTIEGDRLYMLGHLGEALCFDANGLANGNDGPFKDEEGLLATSRKRVKSEIEPDGRRIMEWTAGIPGKLDALDADIVWRFDMIRNANCWPFNALNGAILVRGDRLYVPTCSALSFHGQRGSKLWIDQWKKDNHKTSYPSPSLIVLDKATGKLLAVDKAGIFDETFHGSHSSPALGVVNGKELLFYAGGNGTCYAFDPDFTPNTGAQPGELKLVWKFNCLAPSSYEGGVPKPLKRAETIASPVFYKNRIYTSIGNDFISSGERAGGGRLVCIDATKTGDITRTGRIWSLDTIRSTGSTVAIADGLLYTADAAGNIYCVDAETGKVLWQHETPAIWSSPLVADGKVYVCTHSKGMIVFAAGREKRLIAQSGSSPMDASPAAANGVLYVASQRYLYALETGKTGGLVKNPE